MEPRPDGVVTFVLTDVVGSTRLWERETASAAKAAVQQMYDVVGTAIADAGGFAPAEQGEGDSVVGAFRRPSDALRAAVRAQRDLRNASWPTSEPVRVRMAVHTGEAILRGDRDYLGPAIIRTARLRALAHGAQVLVSGVTRDLAAGEAPPDATLLDLGVHRLRDLAEPEHVFQLVHPDIERDFPRIAAATLLQGDAPLELTPLLGREAEVATLGDLLERSRLVTVTGPGGSGKTRLAARTAQLVSERFAGGAFFVDLSSLADADLLDTAVATALGVVPGATGVRAAVTNAVGTTPILIVLDNGEHLVDDLADLVVDLLRSCPSLVVLVTSRVILDVPGEVGWQVPPLDVPAVDATPAVVDASAAVALFAARATEHRMGFAVTDANRSAVAAIVRRLDGLPLGIELAAARVRSMSPEEIASSLDDALGLLVSRSARRIPRQRTLEASIAWSYDLLDSVEQAVLRRLGIFAGAPTLDDVLSVLADDALPRMSVLHAIDRLVEHSLVSVVDTDGSTSVRLLEMVRQFARHRLDDAGETPAVTQRHADHHLGWLDGRGLEIEANAALSDDFERRIDDFRAALRFVEAREPHRYARAVSDFAGLWTNRPGLLEESTAMVKRALEAAPEDDPVLRARLLVVAAHFALTTLDPDAERHVHAAVEAARATGDDLAIGSALSSQIVLAMRSDESQARELATEALERLQAAGAAAKANWIRYMLSLTSMATGRGNVAEIIAEWETQADTTAVLEVQVIGMARLQAHDHLGALHALSASPREIGRASAVGTASETFGLNFARVRAGFDPIDPDELLAAAERADLSGEAFAASTYRAAATLSLAVQGRLAEARAALPRAHTWVRATEMVPLAVALALDGGDIDDAAAECDTLSERADRSDSPLYRARVLWLRAWVSLARGEHERATKLGLAAVERASEGQFLRELVHALETLAASYRARGDSEPAEAAHTEARRIRYETHYRWNLIGPPVEVTAVHSDQSDSSARRARSTAASFDSASPDS